MKKLFLLLFVFFSFSFTNIKASNLKVYIGGDSIGMNMDTSVTVKSLFSVDNHEPWKDLDLEVGSIIKELDNKQINSNEDVTSVISYSKSNVIDISYSTNGKSFEGKIKAIERSNSYSLGILLTDNLSGVGTMTFIKQDLTFGSLGHIIKTSATTGVLNNSNVTGIKKSINGVPGFKKATLGSEKIGIIDRNDFTGVYGVVQNNDYISDKELFEVANKSEVKIGEAEIYTVVNGANIEKYKIEVTEKYSQSSKDIKSMKIKIVDKELLEISGGIVQGMSGSPIIQNNKIIGAVTHVTINNPTIGYGIYIDWMIN